MGSVFSPHYARAHARAASGQPAARHLAINLALYGERRAWVFTEAQARPGDLSADALRVAGNTWHSSQDGIVLTINDRSVPWRRPVVGRITLRGTRAQNHGPQVLRADGGHHWWPLMPVGRIEVDMQHPKLKWQGSAYHDLNFGDEPLARGFRSWSWMRSTQGDTTDIVYVPEGRGAGACASLSLQVHRDGTARAQPMPKLAPLSKSRWGLTGKGILVPAQKSSVRLLEDTPFYRRSCWTAPTASGPPADIMHEALDMDRWSQAWVQALMQFRLRRT